MKVDAPNIILITIDCLRYDHLGCYGYNRNITPNIDNLASRGVIFAKAISNGGQTCSAFPSILASALPPLKMDEDKEIMRRSTTLAELLKGVGYHTAGFHSNPNLRQALNYDKGFDSFEDSLNKRSALQRQKIRERLGMKLHPLTELKFCRSVVNCLAKLWRFSIVADLFISGPPYLRAGEITKQAVEWWKDRKGKSFLWLHYMDVHAPYMPLPKYLSEFRTQPVSRRKMVSLREKIRSRPSQLSTHEVATLIDLYDAEIRCVDDAVGQLLDSLGNDLANTIVVVTADHGDEFGEHGRFQHRTLYDGIVHVPLIMAGPGINGGTKVKHQVRLLDLAPTVAELVGIDKVHGFQGESLLPAIRGKEDAVRGAISTLVKEKERMIAYRIPGWKYIQTESLDASETMLAEELYDLTNDPGEAKNLHDMDYEEANNFELEAKNRLSQFKQLKIEEKTTYEKQRVKARIERLRKR